MAEEKGVVVRERMVELVSTGDLVLRTTSGTAKISVIQNNQTMQELGGGTNFLKTHTAYTGSGVSEKTFAATTADATATVVWSLPVPLSSTVGVRVFAVGKKDGANADGFVSCKWNACTNNAGTVAAVGTTGGSDVENSAGTPAVTIVANNTDDTIEVKVTGISAETWHWTGKVEYQTVTAAA